MLCSGRLPFLAGAAVLLQAVSATSQASSSSTLSLSPAATQVANSSNVLQLTDVVLETVSQQLTEKLGNASLAALFSFASNSTTVKRSSGTCKTYAGDSSWPSNLIWEVFDLLLGKALLDVPPIASPCYTDWDNYDENYCAFLTSNFTDSFLHMDHPSSIMSPFYQGATCMPIDGAPSNCTLGGYPYYVVNATNVAQVQLAVNLARTLDLRLVIKNTGHDFAGKSAGAGALSIWTHHFKSVEFLPKYKSSGYSGTAFKIGSGVQSYELYAAAKEQGVTVIGGEGETVGVAGGYIQGGGHSPLSSIYGLAADQVLAYEVVTADGRFVTASDTVNSDLFWALRGGGGSTFGVVTSATVKAWPKVGVATSTFTFTTSDTLSSETFWLAMQAYWSHFLTFVDAGAYSYARFYAIGVDEYYFGMTPFFCPNMTVAEHDALLQPWLDELSALGIDLEVNATYYDNFYDAWAASFPLETVGLDAGRISSRLFPRANWENATLMNETFAAVRNTTENGYYFTAFNMKTELHPDNTANSANTAWRDSVLHAITAIAWTDGTSAEEILELSDGMTYGAMDQWRAVTPGSGSYLGEVSLCNLFVNSLRVPCADYSIQADSSEPNFQSSFWGSNYDRLYSIKKSYDPYDVFYARNAVGSESWEVQTEDGLPTQNGKLCSV
jgi:hypothetical protein